MRPRYPLYAKILGWFFLNLALLAAVVGLLLHAQFPLNLDSLLASGARERLEAVRDLIVGELNLAQPAEWAGVLQRYDKAYRVEFALFDDDAQPLLGGIADVPEAVRERMVPQPRSPDRSRSSGEASTSGARASDAHGEGPRLGRFRPPVRALVRTTDPTRYWLLSSARLDNPLAGDPMRVILVARSESASAGGLIFDPRPWLYLGVGTVVFSLLFWLPLVRGITRSIGLMTAATRQIAAGRFEVRVPVRRHDELGLLGSAVNEMAARLDGFTRGQKRFLGDIAHELCSPLAKLQMALGILEEQTADRGNPYARTAAEKAAQIASLVGELLSFSKASFGAAAVHLEPVRIRDIAEEALRREATDGADIQLHIAGDLVAAADPELLLRAVSNLLRNAIRHAGSAGPITLAASLGDRETVIEVSDCGPGVPEAELPKIFDAFYRLDASRTRDTGGTGLGLTIVKACVESCCGTVAAHNRMPQGLRVEIRLSGNRA